MAIDSATKRKSVVGIPGRAFRPPVVEPDATPGVEWRQAVGGVYGAELEAQLEGRGERRIAPAVSRYWRAPGIVPDPQRGTVWRIVAARSYPVSLVPDVPDPPGIGSLYFLVRHTDILLGIPGAFVTVGSTVKVTDGSGEVTFADLEAQEYAYTVSAPGYEQATGTVTAVEESTVSTTVDLTPLAVGTVGDAAVWVTNENDEPVAGALVTVGGVQGVTDNDGFVSLTSIEAGEREYSVSSENYVTVTGAVEIFVAEESLLYVTLVYAIEPTYIVDKTWCFSRRGERETVSCLRRSDESELQLRRPPECPDKYACPQSGCV